MKRVHSGQFPPTKKAKTAPSAAWAKRFAALGPLDEQQQAAFDAIKGRRNVFLTGEAGCGKTRVTEHVLKAFVDMFGPSGVLAVSTTNLVAGALGGETIHAAFGVGIHELTHEARFQRHNRAVDDKLREIELLIIEEISMVHPDLFEYMDYALRAIRRSSAPFGGVQVFMVGDFFQLGPIFKRGETVVYTFETDAWRRLRPRVMCLTVNHRQDTDAEFLRALALIRLGRADEDVRALLGTRMVAQADRPPLGRVPYLTLAPAGVPTVTRIFSPLIAPDGRSYAYGYSTATSSDLYVVDLRK